MTNPTIHRNFWTVLSELQDKFPGGIISRQPQLENYYQMTFGAHNFPPMISVFWDGKETAATRGRSGIHVIQEGNSNALCLNAINPSFEMLQGWLKCMHENIVASCYAAVHTCGFEMGTTALQVDDTPRLVLGTDLLDDAGSITIVAGHPATGKSLLLLRITYDHLSCDKPVTFFHELKDQTFLQRYARRYGETSSTSELFRPAAQISEDFTIPDVPPGTLVILDSVVAYAKLDWETLKKAALERQIHLVVAVQLPRTATPETWQPGTKVEQTCDVVACTSGLNKPLYISKHRTEQTGWFRSPIIPVVSC